MLGSGMDDGRHSGDELPVIESEGVYWFSEFGYEGGFTGWLGIGFCLVFYNEYELIN